MITALCIDKLLPAAQYGGVPGHTEQEYNSLRWEDERTKPIWSEIESAWILVQVDMAKDVIKGQIAALDKYLPRPVEDQYTILITAEIITAASLDNIAVYTDTTLLDIYNQKKALRATL